MTDGTEHDAPHMYTIVSTVGRREVRYNRARSGMLFRPESVLKEIMRGMRDMHPGGASAAAAARRLIALDATFAPPYLLLGTMLAEEGNLEEAESMLWQGVAQQPGMAPF